MNKKLLSVIFAFLALILVALFYFVTSEKEINKENSQIQVEEEQSITYEPLDISKITEDQIIDLLGTNSDSKEYIEKYKGFKIEAKTPLTKESIVAGQNAGNFREVYQDLDLEDGRYLRADLMNAAGNWGLIAVLDLKTRSVLKAFGLMLVQANMQTDK